MKYGKQKYNNHSYILEKNRQGLKPYYVEDTCTLIINTYECGLLCQLCFGHVQYDSIFLSGKGFFL